MFYTKVVGFCRGACFGQKMFPGMEIPVFIFQYIFRFYRKNYTTLISNIYFLFYHFLFLKLVLSSIFPYYYLTIIPVPKKIKSICKMALLTILLTLTLNRTKVSFFYTDFRKRNWQRKNKYLRQK